MCLCVCVDGGIINKPTYNQDDDDDDDDEE